MNSISQTTKPKIRSPEVRLFFFELGVIVFRAKVFTLIFTDFALVAYLWQLTFVVELCHLILRCTHGLLNIKMQSGGDFHQLDRIQKTAGASLNFSRGTLD